MYKVVILPLAKKDVKDAADWYNSRQQGLGKRFTFHVRKKINLIKSEPFIYVNRYDEVKTAILDAFPFMIHYSVENSDKLITISAILHTSLNPDIWGSRSTNVDDIDL